MPGRVTRETLHGHVIYPDNLPRRRGNMIIKCSIFLIFVILAICLKDWKSGKEGNCSSFVVCLVCYLNLQLVLEFLWRLLCSTEERLHLKSRHKGSLWHLGTKLVTFSWPSLCYIFFCIFGFSCILLLGHDMKDHIRSVSQLHMIGIYVIGDLLRRLIDLSKNPVHDSMLLEKLQRLDYGSGIAQSFFYGYLRLCLPNTGDQEKGILERIDDYIARQDLPEDSFPVKKIFILIPSSTYVPNDLKDCSFGLMESAGPLEEQTRDRAGVKGRHYKNSVYRIKGDPNNPADKDIYVVAEGATPCKTLYEVVQFSGKRKEFYKEHQKEIIFYFYETLRETLREDRDCRDLCEFIYYDDTDEFGLNNVNVGILIKERIEELQRTEAFLRGVRDRNT